MSCNFIVKKMVTKSYVRNLNDDWACADPAPNHNYARPGFYTITLIATGPGITPASGKGGNVLTGNRPCDLDNNSGRAVMAENSGCEQTLI